MQGSHVITQGLKSVKQVVEVLDLGYGPQTAHRHANPLPHDGKLADAGIKDPVHAIFVLQSRKSLVHITDVTEVLAKGAYQRVGSKELVEITVQHFKSIYSLGITGKFQLGAFYIKCRPGPFI